jgi:hypothetical protein
MLGDLLFNVIINIVKNYYAIFYTLDVIIYNTKRNQGTEITEVMTTNNTVIRETTIIFTDNQTSISTEPQQIERALKIKITPNAEGNNISHIAISYNGRDCGRLNNHEIFDALTMSLQSPGHTLLERITNYLNNLPTEEFQIIIRQYGLYIEDGIIIDGVIAGIAAYLSLLFINEQHISVLMPFTFLAPADIHGGNSVNRNMFRVLTVPLAALLRHTNKITVQLASFVSSFINIWDALFIEGPMMPEVNDIRMAIDIIGQLTQNISLTLDDKVKSHINMVTSDLVERHVQLSLQRYTNEFTASKHSSRLSEIDEGSFKQSSSEADNTTKVAPQITQRNHRYTTQPVKIQSTGRISGSSPLPWRK